VISEVIALRMNEEVAGQLHSGLISITDDHQDRLHRMETHIEGLEEENAHLKALGAEGVLPGRQIESFLRVCNQFAPTLPSG